MFRGLKCFCDEHCGQMAHVRKRAVLVPTHRCFTSRVEGLAAILRLHQGQHRRGKQLPPLQQVVGVQSRRVLGVSLNRLVLGVIGVVPWFYFAKEVNYFGFMPIPRKGRGRERGKTAGCSSLLHSSILYVLGYVLTK